MKANYHLHNKNLRINLSTLSFSRSLKEVFRWLSSHKTIWGNDNADITTKSALFQIMIQFKVEIVLKISVRYIPQNTTEYR